MPPGRRRHPSYRHRSNTSRCFDVDPARGNARASRIVPMQSVFLCVCSRHEYLTVLPYTFSELKHDNERNSIHEQHSTRHTSNPLARQSALTPYGIQCSMPSLGFGLWSLRMPVDIRQSLPERNIGERDDFGFLDELPCNICNNDERDVAIKSVSGRLEFSSRLTDTRTRSRSLTSHHW